jgi:predicted methyltransferase MtxX (methanogen marker protein 4)
MTGLFSAIRANALASRKRVAIGLTKPTAELIADLRKARDFAEIVIVGASVNDFECVSLAAAGGDIDDRKASDCLMSLVKDHQVDAIVRGQIYYTDYHDSMNAHFGFERDVMCPYLLRDLCDNEWFITPVVHHDDASIAGRCYLASQTARICKKLVEDVVIGVLAPDKKKEVGYAEVVDRGISEAETIVGQLKAEGFNAHVVELRIDLAAANSHIVVPMDGIVGNFVYRSLGSLGGAMLVGGFTLTNQFVSIDTSQSQKGYSDAIEAAVAVVNFGGMPVTEY